MVPTADIKAVIAWPVGPRHATVTPVARVVVTGVRAGARVGGHPRDVAAPLRVAGPRAGGRAWGPTSGPKVP